MSQPNSEDSRRHRGQHSVLQRHEQSLAHKTALRRHKTSSSSAPIPDDTLSQETSETTAYLSSIGIEGLLRSMAGIPAESAPAQHFADQRYSPENQSQDSSLPAFFNLAVDENTEMQSSPEYAGIQAITESLLGLWKGPDRIDSDDEMDDSERPRDDEQPEEILHQYFSQDSEPSSEHIDKRARNHAPIGSSNEWFPWGDKITCTLDILMHLPRSVFSHKQLDLFLWLLRVNGVQDVPSVKSMQAVNAALQSMCGIETLAYDGALGHRYHVNSLAQIIAQEMANPQIRPNLSFYPEDSGRRISEARQAQAWLHEVPDELVTPMARIGNDDYYIHEPAMLNDESCVIPYRWFTRNGALFAKCWKMSPRQSEHYQGWSVSQDPNYEVSHQHFLKPFPELRSDVAAGRYPVPCPTLIIDVIDPKSRDISAWKYTNPVLGNPWRERAQGSRVVSFPIWLYCDDTSGNVSKKWNKHNSFLFTAAGLPREESQKEYNVHFLCTSNLAQPLEMLDGIADQLDLAQQNGIWSWDCESNEPILVIPFVLAMLGDNPMQSEFACHIGLRGKFFCRICKVKGKDATDEVVDVPPPDEEAIPSLQRNSEANDDADSDNSSVVSSDNGSAESVTSQSSKPGTTKPKKNKVPESLENMLRRIKDFIKPGESRTKIETQSSLNTQFIGAQTPHFTSRLKKLRTETGVKDTYFDHFLNGVESTVKKVRGTAAKTTAHATALQNLPSQIYSPVWRIKGLDPHSDTPVEILHVILLGFIKYLWRDVVQNQIKKTEKEKRDLLVTRLNSLDVSGLGISPLNGNTLVTYAGSLTGRDFRVIAQVAPLVIYDLVSPECLATWTALSNLVPKIWQPVIDDIDAFVNDLEKDIQQFLLCTARWTSRWFNKPKFHILVHLPAHIRRFGPAMLFATEAFESFNAVIRAKSVHSNRHAPSRDIARAFAQGNRIRHLLSKGLFHAIHPENLTAGSTSPNSRSSFSRSPDDWKTVGSGPLTLVFGPSAVTRYLGITPKTSYDMAITDIDDFVIAKEAANPPFIGQVKEILQQVGSVAAHSQRADCVLLERLTTASHIDGAYGMPALAFTGINQTVSPNILYEERTKTTKTRPKIEHLVNPKDLLLNTAQMRDAIEISPFRLAQAAPLDSEEILLASALQEIKLRKKNAARALSTISIGIYVALINDMSLIREWLGILIKARTMHVTTFYIRVVQETIAPM
ncbi:hypothetical protein C8J56DRAFT_1022550 [Mycena floridula]|nr:hypothetical protein C8J56DRAFT_1022550 [Mycena floridula]